MKDGTTRSFKVPLYSTCAGPLTPASARIAGEAEAGPNLEGKKSIIDLKAVQAA